MPLSQKPLELLPALAEEGLDNRLLDIHYHPALAHSLGVEGWGGGVADGSGASNRKFKGFCKATSTQLSIKLSFCRRQDLVSGAWGGQQHRVWWPSRLWEVGG